MLKYFRREKYEAKLCEKLAVRGVKSAFITAFNVENNNLRIKKLRLSFLFGVADLLADLDSGALLPRACLAG